MVVGVVQVRQVEYQAKGLALRGTLAVPDGAGPFPGVLIGHEGPGLDDIQRARAADIAQLGYVGLALDYHGQHSPFTDRAAMMARLDHLSAHPDETRALGAAALDVLLAEPAIDGSRVAAIGYCYGATITLELARSGIPLRAVVGFHPGLRTIRPQDARNITGRVLMFVGADDPFIPLEHRLEFEQEMRRRRCRLATRPVRRRATQLHPPTGVPGRHPRHRLRPARRHPQLASHGHPPRRRLLTKYGSNQPGGSGRSTRAFIPSFADSPMHTFSTSPRRRCGMASSGRGLCASTVRPVRSRDGRALWVRSNL